MNQLFCHPEIITLKKAVYYDIAPIPLPVPFKDGTGGVRHASFFKGWMKIYDEDGFCGQGPAGPLMTDFFLPRMLDVPGKSNGAWMEYFWWEVRNFGYQSPYIAEMTNLDWLLLDLLANRAGLPLHRFLGALHLVLRLQQPVVGQAALAMLQLGHGVIVLLHRQGGPGGVQYLLIVLHLEVQGAEAVFKAL